MTALVSIDTATKECRRYVRGPGGRAVFTHVGQCIDCDLHMEMVEAMRADPDQFEEIDQPEPPRAA